MLNWLKDRPLVKVRRFHGLSRIPGFRRAQGRKRVETGKPPQSERRAAFLTPSSAAAWSTAKVGPMAECELQVDPGVANPMYPDRTGHNAIACPNSGAEPIRPRCEGNLRRTDPPLIPQTDRSPRFPQGGTDAAARCGSSMWLLDVATDSGCAIGVARIRSRAHPTLPLRQVWRRLHVHPGSRASAQHRRPDSV